jgi:hypothetical protein
MRKMEPPSVPRGRFQGLGYPWFAATFRNGASRIRTGDLLGAIQALFQLSYSPERRGPKKVPAASQGEDTRMGFGFPAAGGGWAAVASGGLKSSDVAPIALAFQARVPEKAANRIGSAPIDGYSLASAPPSS